jgi:hypothetical protein
MKLIISLLCSFLIQSAAAAPKRVAQVQTSDMTYEVLYEEKIFKLQSSLLNRQIPVKDCNKSVFSRVWGQIQRNAKGLGSEKRKTKHDVKVSLAGQQRYLPINSKAGLYFQGLPSKMLALGIESDRLCGGQ